MEEINTSLRDNQEKKQTNNLVEKTVQDLKMEIEAIKKKQMEGILEMGNLGN